MSRSVGNSLLVKGWGPRGDAAQRRPAPARPPTKSILPAAGSGTADAYGFAYSPVAALNALKSVTTHPVCGSGQVLQLASTEQDQTSALLARNSLGSSFAGPYA